MDTDFVVVGSGPGGATLARELARAGRDVVILERGKRHPITSRRIDSLRMYDKGVLFSRSREGVIIDRAITLGGCSVVFSGTSFDPPAWIQEEMGLDLSAETAEIKEDIGIRPFSDEFMAPWKGTHKLRQAAADLGVDMRPQSKFIREASCRNTCDGCIYGCRNNAKWTAREWVDDAVSLGARVVTEANVQEVLVESGRAVGVKARTTKGTLTVRASGVVVSAGGIGSAVLLQRSGVEAAGGNFYMDPMNVLWGMTHETHAETREMSFSHASEDTADSRGFMLANLSGKGAWFNLMLRPSVAWRVMPYYGKWDRMVGMFTKVADSAEGRVFPDSKMSKPFNAEDRERDQEATDLARRIMVRAGVRPRSIHIARNIGGHPGGTASIGTVVDTDLQVKGIKGLFVCDASVFPRSPGRPPTLMIMALARKFGRALA